MKVEKLIPEVYYTQSRDFGYIGRLFEILFNYMKTGSDCISVNPDSLNLDATTIELVALTLGFESKHKYTTRDLIYVISSFSDLIKKKGTKEAINNAVKLLLNSQKIKDAPENNNFVQIAQESEIDKFIVTVQVPSQMTDIILLEDLFDYILPAGLLYKINKVADERTTIASVKIESKQDYSYSPDVDTSSLFSSELGGYIYVLLTSKPDDWDDESSEGVFGYANYYVYDDVGGAFIPNTFNTYEDNKFYRKDNSLDIGTIISGTVASTY